MTYSPTYKRVHRQLHHLRGRAKDYVCECGEPALEWAYQFTGETLWDSNGRRPHSVNIDDYAAMCRRCHEHFDREHDPEMAKQKNLWGGNEAAVKALAARWSDPAFAEKMQGVLTQNSHAIAERRKTDLVFDRGIRERTRQTLAKRMATDPEYAEQKREQARRMTRVRKNRRCLECGMVSSPGGLGNHRRFTGHDNYVNEESTDE